MTTAISTIISILEGEILQDWGSSPLQKIWQDHYQRANNPDDEWSADHYQLFGLEVFPFAAVYFSDIAQMGGSAVNGVLDAYKATEWDGGSQPDHLAQELKYLDHLVVSGKQDQAAQFLGEQLLPWAPIFLIALKNQHHPFFTAVAQEIEDHLRGLIAKLKPQPFVANLYPVEVSFLDDEDTGLKDIARMLLIPASSGFYLSRADQMELAQSIGAPAGFGTRSQILPSLFKSAVDFDKFPALLAALQEVISGWQDNYASRSEFGPWLTPWVECLSQSQKIVKRLAEEV